MSEALRDDSSIIGLQIQIQIKEESITINEDNGNYATVTNYNLIISGMEDDGNGGYTLVDSQSWSFETFNSESLVVNTLKSNSDELYSRSATEETFIDTENNSLLTNTHIE